MALAALHAGPRSSLQHHDVSMHEARLDPGVHEACFFVSQGRIAGDSGCADVAHCSDSGYRMVCDYVSLLGKAYATIGGFGKSF